MGPQSQFSLARVQSQDGIRHVPKQPFKELEERGLRVGDQIWLVRDQTTTSCNPVVCMCRMSYAHVMVYVGDGKVVHVGTKAGCCKGIMKGTIKKESIRSVIKPDDQGRCNQDNMLITIYTFQFYWVIKCQK